MASNERVGITLDVLPGTFAGVTAALGGFNELVAATSMFSKAIADSTSVIDAMTLTLGVALAGAAWESAKAFGELERGMKIVQAVSGQTSSQIGILTEKANEFSVTYKLGIDDITAGLQTLGRAGLSNVNTQLDTMQAGLQAAKIQGMELNDALEKIVATTALLGGDLKSANFGQQAEKLTSQLLSTAMTAPIDLNDVVQTLSYSGGTAAAAGINIQNDDALYDYLGAISAFAQKGVKGSMAGTAMRAFFTKPASQDTSVVEAFNKLKMKPSDLWEEGGNAMRPVSEQIDIIHNQMEKLHMSTLDQIELWGKIVGPKMGQQMMKLDSSVIKATSREIRQTASATELANMTMDNFLSDVSTLEQKGQRAWRGYGEAALAWIGPVIKGLNGLFDILGTDIGGIPIFQQFVKMGIIIVISQIIQKLGAVKNLFVGIVREMRNMWGAMSKTERTVEEEVAAERKRLQALGLTEDQAQALANAEGKIAGNLGTSNKVLAEFLAKLNQAVTLMSELATLSRVNSMNMISSISGAQFNRRYGTAGEGMSDGAWYKQHQGNMGHLTKNEFASLSLRHGMNTSDLMKIYDSKEFQKYAQTNQTGRYAFPTAVSLEKYLQENKKGLYDPKVNPIVGIVSNIQQNTDIIAKKGTTGPSQSSGQSSKNNLVNQQKYFDKASSSYSTNKAPIAANTLKYVNSQTQTSYQQEQEALQTRLTTLNNVNTLEQKTANILQQETSTKERSNSLGNEISKEISQQRKSYSQNTLKIQREAVQLENTENQIKELNTAIQTQREKILNMNALRYPLSPHQQASGRLVNLSTYNEYGSQVGSNRLLQSFVGKYGQEYNIKGKDVVNILQKSPSRRSAKEAEIVALLDKEKNLLSQELSDLEQQLVLKKEERKSRIESLANSNKEVEKQAAHIVQLEEQYTLYQQMSLFERTNLDAENKSREYANNIALSQADVNGLYNQYKTRLKTQIDRLSTQALNQPLSNINAQYLSMLRKQFGSVMQPSVGQSLATGSNKELSNIMLQHININRQLVTKLEAEAQELTNELQAIDQNIQSKREQIAKNNRKNQILQQEFDTENQILLELREDKIALEEQSILRKQKLKAELDSLKEVQLGLLEQRGITEQKLKEFSSGTRYHALYEARMRELDAEMQPIALRMIQIRDELGAINRDMKTMRGDIKRQEAITKQAESALNQHNSSMNRNVKLEQDIANLKNESVQIQSRLDNTLKTTAQLQNEINEISGIEISLRKKIITQLSANGGVLASWGGYNTYLQTNKDINKIMGAQAVAKMGQPPRGVTAGVQTTSTAMPGAMPSPTTMRNAQDAALQYEFHQSLIKAISYERGLEKSLMQQDSIYRRNVAIAQEEIGIKQRLITELNTQIGLKHEEIAEARNMLMSKNIILSLENDLKSLEQSKITQERTITNLNSQIIKAKISALNRAGIGTTGLGGVAQPSVNVAGNTITRFSVPLGLTSVANNPSGFLGSMRNSFVSGFAQSGRYIEGGGKFWNWMNMGMTGMVNWDNIRKANVGLGTLGKVSNIAGGALGSLGMMFGPFEIAMMGVSLVMQGVQAAQQRYKEELEKINSQLSEAREKFEKAEEAFLGAYEEQNPNATQDQKDEALLNLYANGPGDRDDGLDSYRTRVFGTLSQIEINTRKKAEKENDWLWGSRGAMQKHFWSPWDETWGWIFDDRKNLTRDEWNEQATIARENAAVNDQDENEVYGITNHPYNDASFMEQYFKDTFHLEEIDKNLNHYENWVDDLEDYSEQAKYATSIMSQGVDATGPTKDSSWIRTFKDFTQEQLQAGVWGSKNGINDYRKFEESLSKIPETVKTQIANSINQDPDFYKSMQRQMFEFSNGKLQSRGEKREEKILEAIRRRVGNISAEQARQTLILSTISSINDFVQNQVQPAVLANVDAAMQGTQILGLTNTSVGYTGSSTAAVHQYVMVITSQLGQIVKQKALENASLLAESSGVRFEDLTKLAKEGTGAQGLSKTYTEQDANQAKQIFESMGQSLYQGPMMTKGMSQEDALKYAKTKFDKLNTSGSSLADMLHTWDQWFGFTMTPYIEEQWAKNLQDTTGKASGPTETDKDKDKNKDKDSSKDTANKKNWVNLAICNKKEIPKLNVNLFKKPPNFTILNRNFKLRDVNVNTADDAKSIQNAVKNSIIEIQNRSNPKIIQDDAAEYDPLAATEGNTLPTGTKKTE